MSNNDFTNARATPAFPRWTWASGGFVALLLILWALLPSEVGTLSFDRVVHQSVAVGIAFLMAERAVRYGGPLGFAIGGVTLTMIACLLITAIVGYFF